jgi:hypothetical protein
MSTTQARCNASPIPLMCPFFALSQNCSLLTFHYIYFIYPLSYFYLNTGKKTRIVLFSIRRSLFRKYAALVRSPCSSVNPSPLSTPLIAALATTHHRDCHHRLLRPLVCAQHCHKWRLNVTPHSRLSDKASRLRATQLSFITCQARLAAKPKPSTPRGVTSSMPFCTSSFITMALVPPGSRARAAATTASTCASCACRSAFAAFRAPLDMLDAEAGEAVGNISVGGEGGGDVMRC